MNILGAGLSGCIAALLIPQAEIYEPFSQTKLHQAILRFRSCQIGKALGIPFKKVIVHKGIWHNSEPVQLAPKYIVRYARKVSQSISARSIINLEPSERFIAPVDFHDQMLDLLKDRIHYKAGLNKIIHKGQPIISTLPMDVLQKMLGYQIPVNQMMVEQIYVSRYIMQNCDVHLTNYYTGTNTGVYRASISGDELIIESTFKIEQNDLEIVRQSFGLDGIPLSPLVTNYIQMNGKLNPMDEELRKHNIFELTNKHNIYSLGRFATWRNIVLDDVYKDILRIKEWANQSDYDRVAK